MVSNASASLPSNTVSLVQLVSEQTLQPGQPFTLTANPTGTGPFTYQWYLNGLGISGAESSSYSSTASASGIYSVIVSSSSGSQTEYFGVTVPPRGVDTPTMPEWMLILMAGLLVLAGGRSMARFSQRG